MTWIIRSEDSACLKAGNRIEDGGVCNEETSCGLSQSGDCWRPESLRGRTIHFSLCDGVGFRQVRDEAAGAGDAQSGTAGPHPDQLPPGDPALPVENEYRNDRVLGGGKSGGNNPVPNYKSSWDFNWTANYGGTDNPEPSARRNYIPIAFVPRQNPFYFALPYNDVTHGQFKPEAPLVIPWFKQSYTGPGQSVCRNRWISIRKGNRLCYAQWEDCGPFRTDHFQYVFGNERPKPNLNHGAGLDVSPAVRDYLGLAPTDVADWQFVEVRDVPPGPWRSYGDNNHFVIARRQSEQRVAAGGGGAAKK